VLAEEIVIEAGFGEDGTSSVAREDLVLTQRKMKLRTAANALLDLGLHAASMTDADAMRAADRCGAAGAREAEGKLRRAKLTCGAAVVLLRGLRRAQGAAA
jgi:hypothetical protein